MRVCYTSAELWQTRLQTSHPLTFFCLAGLLLKRQKTVSRTKEEHQLRNSAALAHVAPGDEQLTKTKAADLDGSQESSGSDSKPATKTSWQLWELVTGSTASTEGQHGCMSFDKLRITPLVSQGHVPAFVAGNLGSQYSPLGPDDANMKHEDITLCRNEQGRPIKLGQGGFGKVSLFTASPNNPEECTAPSGVCVAAGVQSHEVWRAANRSQGSAWN